MKPKNQKLYDKVKEEAKTIFKKWPSAYASGWVVKEYKRRGGKFLSEKPKNTGLTRWFEEEWINVCELPKIVPCGRNDLTDKNWKKKYPYCRPKKKITPGTPDTISELKMKELKRRCRQKRKDYTKRVNTKIR